MYIYIYIYKYFIFIYFYFCALSFSVFVEQLYAAHLRLVSSRKCTGTPGVVRHGQWMLFSACESAAFRVHVAVRCIYLLYTGRRGFFSFSFSFSFSFFSFFFFSFSFLFFLRQVSNLRTVQTKLRTYLDTRTTSGRDV